MQLAKQRTGRRTEIDGMRPGEGRTAIRAMLGSIQTTALCGNRHSLAVPGTPRASCHELVRTGIQIPAARDTGCRDSRGTRAAPSLGIQAYAQTMDAEHSGLAYGGRGWI